MQLSKALAAWALLVAHSNAWAQPVRIETGCEDSLTLNIWTQAKSREQKLPVMVWIPGGGLYSGIRIDPTLLG